MPATVASASSTTTIPKGTCWSVANTRAIEIVLICIGLLVTAALGEAPATAPSPMTQYMGREIAQTMHYSGAEWLTRESRQREEDCATMLKALNVKPGDVVCDLGCGNGFYTLKLAEMVGPSGKVLAVEIQPEMLEMLRVRAERAHVENIERILGTAVDPKLPEGQVDLVLMVDVYHELSNPAEVLAAVRKSLKPTGRMAQVEFRAEDEKVPIKPLHKMSKAQILKEIPANGFKLIEQFNGLPWQHLMFFQRDEAPATRAATRAAATRPTGRGAEVLTTPCLAAGRDEHR
jgi:ubiquinone/menaquinone biosynthesis C-methylase UbiE